VAGAYSNDQSLLRVAVCIMMDINEDWITGKRYCNYSATQSNLFFPSDTS